MTVWRLILTDGRLLFAFLVCLVSLGGFLAWAALAPLAKGVVAYGAVEVENDRKIVQHLEGGIIDQILVNEGDVVEAGDALVVLVDVAASAGRDQIEEDLVNHLASIDRLNALLSEAPSLSFAEPQKDLELEPARRADILARQSDLFDQQRRRLSADIRVLRSRADGLAETARNKQAQIDGQVRSVEIIRTDLARKTDLLADNLISGDSVVKLERDLTAAESELFRLQADQESNLIQAREVENQILLIEEQFAEQAAQDLLDARANAAEARERLRAAQDVVNRTSVFAPLSGEILNLKYSTIGGVVQAGDPILEIVPLETQLIASLEVSPTDRDGVYEGLTVKTRLSGFDSWHAPSLEGQIVDVSADLKTSPRGDYSFYEARVVIDTVALAEHGLVAAPGMPVEAFIVSGETQTLLNYIIEPITAVFRRGVKE